ncbi:MAG TPA: PQQ-dependent sugar dehydrogenase, partial [Thermoanaerobaculia bacterium]|nr:PQQ-dependent sugar dehydrogenase [Thermoanaerobaculia bacterium]
LAAAAILALALAAPFVAAAATLPVGFIETRITTGPHRATHMTLVPDGRIFLCHQDGRVLVVKDGALLARPLLQLAVSNIGERGLQSLALDPAFADNGFFYVYYAARQPAIHNRVSRFTAIGDVAVPGSEVPLLDLENLGAEIHNGGALQFGPDGKLYVSVGENGVSENAQSLTTRLGKILRLEPDGSIPPDNPFFAVAEGLNRAIWALGLRNPFQIAFAHDSDRMFINDVGESHWEEVDLGVAGANYGWPIIEGPKPSSTYRRPTYAYRHSEGCAITGGAVYDPPVQQFPAEYRDSYFFADFCGGWIRRLAPGGTVPTTFATGIDSALAVAVSDEGDLYYLTRHKGIFRVRFAGLGAPQIGDGPHNLLVAAGQPASFSVTASGAQPLRYQWRRGGAPIAGATAPIYTLPAATLLDHGASFDVLVSNAEGTATGGPARLTVVAGSPPVGRITAPPNGRLYQGGDVVTFIGTGSDAEDGVLPRPAFTWQVDFHHETHIHPFLPPRHNLRRGTFRIPIDGETSSRVWYRIHLTVRDASGLAHSSFVDLLPRKAQITLATDPPGLTVTLDGQPQRAPVAVTGVTGIERRLGATSPQILDGIAYEFDSWSDQGAQEHTISTPAANRNYVVHFRPVPVP